MLGAFFYGYVLTQVPGINPCISYLSKYLKVETIREEKNEERIRGKKTL